MSDLAVIHRQVSQTFSLTHSSGALTGTCFTTSSLPLHTSLMSSQKWTWSILTLSSPQKQLYSHQMTRKYSMLDTAILVSTCTRGATESSILTEQAKNHNLGFKLNFLQLLRYHLLIYLTFRPYSLSVLHQPNISIGFKMILMKYFFPNNCHLFTKLAKWCIRYNVRVVGLNVH